MDKKAYLALEDGTFWVGDNFGASGETCGEIVFNTGMSGYQEILSDPSYKGQIVLMTYPHIGNYGINCEDWESKKVFLEGFVVRDLCKYPSNYRSRKTLDELLKEKGIIGICGVDTRAITLRIRQWGAQRAVISTLDQDPSSLIQKARNAPSLIGLDLVKQVSCSQPYYWEEKSSDNPLISYSESIKGEEFYVVVYDFGVKFSILRQLAKFSCKIQVVPADTSFREVLKGDPDGVVLSNGPGDPSAVSYGIENIRGLLGKVPIFGICLGHQLLGLALGAKTFKLKFGHHGLNHPVKNLDTSAIEITSQNHGFAVENKTNSSNHKQTFRITHINCNDGSVEGLAHKELPAFSVQYHPEASPGPHDSRYLFEKFINMMRDFKKN